MVRHVKVTRIRTDAEGYDDNGVFHGRGPPVWACDPDMGYSRTVRAWDEREARRLAARIFPNAEIAA
jgi:hypothetical protein